MSFHLTQIEPSERRKIRSKRGINFVLSIIGVPLFWIGTFLIMIGEIGDPDRILLRMISPVALVLLLPHFFGLFDRVSVSLKEIKVSGLISSKTYEWNSISEIQIFINFFGSHNISIKTYDKDKAGFIATSTYRNHANLTKAILEAAMFKTPKVKVTGNHHFAPPPYGIFGSYHDS